MKNVQSALESRRIERLIGSAGAPKTELTFSHALGDAPLLHRPLETQLKLSVSPSLSRTLSLNQHLLLDVKEQSQSCKRQGCFGLSLEHREDSTNLLLVKYTYQLGAH